MYISNGINEIVLSSRIKLQLTNDFISVNKPMLDCISNIVSGNKIDTRIGRSGSQLQKMK